MPTASKKARATTVRTILCGTDFSDPARAAADVAARLALALGASLQVVHVEDSSMLMLREEPTAQQLRSLAGAALEGEVSRLRSTHQVPVAAQLVRGHPAAELARVAEEVSASLIVVSAIGPTPSIFRVGGTAERVAQASHVPVLLVRDPQPLLRWLDGAALATVAMIGDDAASDRAIEWLRALREIGVCDITALHAYYVDDETRRYGLPPRPLVTADPEIEGYVRRDLERRMVALGGRGATTYRAVLAHGRLADHLIEDPAVRGAGLIVIGNHRAHGLARLSSVAAGLVHLAPVSLLVVPVDAPAVVAAPWPEIRHVLVATDFSEFATAAIRHAYGLVAATGGEVTLLHVRSGSQPGVTDETCKTRLAALVPGRPPPGVETRCLVERHDEAATAIHEVAARVGADCIVIASHGRTGLRSLFLGSVAQGVIRAAQRPVLIVRPPGDL